MGSRITQNHAYQENILGYQGATNNFVYWSDGLGGGGGGGGQAFDHHSNDGGRDICQQNAPAEPGIWTNFSNARVIPGDLPRDLSEGMLAGGIDSHITFVVSDAAIMNYF